MAESSSKKEGGRFRRGLSRIRQKFHHTNDAYTKSLQNNEKKSDAADSHAAQKPQLVEVSEKPASAVKSTPNEQNDAHLEGVPKDNQSDPVLTKQIETVNSVSDLWSAAYSEAVASLEVDIDIAILKGSSVAELFAQLEKADNEATHDSVFLRGVAYLRSIQVPLERFKLALDLASPLASAEPAAGIVFSVVQGVTGIAISLATADLEFAKHIGEMLEQISYIDDCDTLGQRSNKQDIHKALVSVYRKILEFYAAAYEILTKRGGKLMLKMMLESDRLPTIVQEFLKEAETLRKLIQKATWEIAEDIKSMLYDSEISRWLGGDKLTLQSRYHTRLQELRADEACQSLLTHPNFLEWYKAPGSQLLAIFGEMGCGKSVAMAFLVDELNRRSEHQIPRPKVCYYYCRNDETGHAAQIFAGLLLALLEQLPGLKKTFFEWYKQRQEAGVLEPATSAKELENFLELIVPTLDRQLFIVVDALDECDRASRQALLGLLTSMSKKTPRLKVILSARPEEEIIADLEHASRINITADSYRDSVIVRHTVETLNLATEVKELVIEALSANARGSAIWTKMTVELIGVRKIKALGPMKAFLKDMPLPKHLSELYRTLIAKAAGDDNENQDLAISALKILAAACRPLSIQELAWAVALAAAPAEIETVAELADFVDCERVTDLIHPFTNRLDFSDKKKQQVQLVHQSVKEFVIREWPSMQNSAAVPVSNQSGKTHDEELQAFILNICIRYLLFAEIGTAPLFSTDQLAIHALPQNIGLFDDDLSVDYDSNCTEEKWVEDMIRYDPAERGFGDFFVYAACYWIKHLGAVGNAALPELAKIEAICAAGSTRLKNWIDQNCRPSCTIIARFDFDSDLYDPLGIVALYGSDAMLRLLLERSDFDAGMYLASPALAAADQVMQWGDLSKIRIMFLEGKLTSQLHSLAFFRLVVKHWRDQRYQLIHDWSVAFDLLDYIWDALVQENWGGELLCIAAEAGCLPLVKRLVEQARKRADLKAQLVRATSAIADAVQGYHISVIDKLRRGSEYQYDHVGVVTLLLAEDGFTGHVEYVNSSGENLLHVASVTADPTIFRLLVPRFRVGLVQADGDGKTPLIRLIESSPPTQAECAKILISHAVENGVSVFGEGMQDPLPVAVHLADVSTCDVLLGVAGMDPLSVLVREADGKYRLEPTPLVNRDAVLEVVLKHAGVAPGN